MAKKTVDKKKTNHKKKPADKSPARKSRPAALARDPGQTASLPSSRQELLRDLRKLFTLLPGEHLDIQASAPSDNGLLVICTVSDEHGAGRFLVRAPAGGPAKVIVPELDIRQLERSGIPPAAARTLHGHVAGLHAARARAFAAIPGPGAPLATAHAAPHHPPAGQAAINAAIYDAAVDEQDRLSSANAAGTDHGNLACAWAVNRIVEEATGSPIDHGLSTIGMHDSLEGGRGTQVDEDAAPPGSIIISPTEGSTHGHVGILGENGLIYSNSSADALWEQNYTLERWKQRYHDGKGLEVLHYTVNG
jgi:hypothetical protein